MRGVPGERGADVGVFCAGRGLTWRPRQGERVALLCAAVVNKAGGEVVVGAVGVRAGEMLQRYTAGGGVREWWLGGGLHL